MTKYDIAVIGTGPAGVSAAITAAVRRKSVILFGSGEMSEKTAEAHTVLNYPGLPNISGQKLAAAFKDHLRIMNIPVTDERVSEVYAMGSYFAIQTSGGMYESQSLILATGVVPSDTLPGEKDFLGRGVSYCATCDAMLFRGKTVAVIGYHSSAEAEAAFISEASAVCYYPMYKKKACLPEAVEVCRSRPLGIYGDKKAEGVITPEGRKPYDGVFVLRDSSAPESLVPGLKLENGHVAVDRDMAANLAGCFACGDVTGPPYQYVKSAGEGNVAALSAVKYIDDKKRRTEK